MDLFFFRGLAVLVDLLIVGIVMEISYLSKEYVPLMLCLYFFLVVLFFKRTIGHFLFKLDICFDRESSVPIICLLLLRAMLKTAFIGFLFPLIPFLRREGNWLSLLDVITKTHVTKKSII